MIEVQSYLEEIKLKLAASHAVKTVDILREHASVDSGFFRARLTLENGDFVEVSEYFVIEGQKVCTIEYRHQWMDAARKVLRKRWDNAEHHPGLMNSPHHVHVGNDSVVQPGVSLSIVDLVDIIESKLAPQGVR